MCCWAGPAVVGMSVAMAAYLISVCASGHLVSIMTTDTIIVNKPIKLHKRDRPSRTAQQPTVQRRLMPQRCTVAMQVKITKLILSESALYVVSLSVLKPHPYLFILALVFFHFVLGKKKLK